MRQKEKIFNSLWYIKKILLKIKKGKKIYILEIYKYQIKKSDLKFKKFNIIFIILNISQVL